MAYFLVRATLRKDLASELRERLDKREFLNMQPFGNSLTRALDDLRYNYQTNGVFWEEEDYCSPPLAMERSAVLDQYFEAIDVAQVSDGEGWGLISELPPLWA